MTPVLSYKVLSRDLLLLSGTKRVDYLIERVDYLKEPYKQLDDKEGYKQVPDDTSVFLNEKVSKNAPAGWFVERQS